MGVAKVVLDGVTQIDLTNDIIDASALAYDETALNSAGEKISGCAQGDNEDAIIEARVEGTYFNPTITVVGRGAFRNCTTIKKAILPSVVNLHFQAFQGCSGLEEIEAPIAYVFSNEGTSTTAYSNNNNSSTFQNCTSLKTVNFPKYISNYNQQIIFNGCTALESVNVRNLLRQNSLSFVNCSSLKNLALPKLSNSTASYAQIGASMCEGCSSLEAFDAGKANSIGATAFKNCTKLKTLILRKTSIQTLSNINAFSGTPFAEGGEGGTIYIPKTLYDALGTGETTDYKAASNWSTIDSYNTITWAQIEDSYYETYSVDGLPIALGISESEPSELTLESITNGVLYDRYGNNPVYFNASGNYILYNTAPRNSGIYYWDGNLSCYNSGNKRWLFIKAGQRVVMLARYVSGNPNGNLSIVLRAEDGTSLIDLNFKDATSTFWISGSKKVTEDTYAYLGNSATANNQSCGFYVEIWIEGVRKL